VYATYPIMGAPALLATLEQFWKVVDQAASQTRQR
jgi:hypothetical protein